VVALWAAVMLRRIAVLLVLVLAGTPGTAVACDVWCAGPSSAEHHQLVGCHEESPISTGTPRLAPIASCHDVVTSGVYLSEVRANDDGAFSVVAVLPANGDSLRIERATVNRSHLKIALARTPAFPSVLRI
jgi:hypothetical protein